MEFGERFHVREAQEQKTRRWQRPREKTVPGGAVAPGREEGARVPVLISFAKPDKTNEHMTETTVVPPEVPRDTRISIEDFVYTDIDEPDIDELRREWRKSTVRDRDQSQDTKKKGKQPGNGTQEPQEDNSQGQGPKDP